jgi:hypothetical protein
MEATEEDKEAPVELMLALVSHSAFEGSETGRAIASRTKLAKAAANLREGLIFIGDLHHARVGNGSHRITRCGYTVIRGFQPLHKREDYAWVSALYLNIYRNYSLASSGTLRSKTGSGRFPLELAGRASKVDS